MTPWLQDPDVTLYHGDCLDVLKALPSSSVHMCATSPPFYGLRDYGVDGQVGLEETPDQWVTSLVNVFREVRRVLRDDGTLWVEIGDSYASNPAKGGSGTYTGRNNPEYGYDRNGKSYPDCKPKDLLGQPWLLAFALRADGWYLRSEIIWARPNPMPESVTDRPTKSHSTIFLLSKQPRYYFDADSIREAYAGQPEVRQGRVGAYQNRAMNGLGDGTTPTRRLNAPVPQMETLDGGDGESPRGPDGRRATHVKGTDASEQHRDGERWPNPSGANARSVWTIPTQPTPFAHFATWPQKLVARMIQAGTSEHGCCPECGKPWVRDVEHESSVSDEKRTELIATAEARGLTRHRASGAQFFSHRTTLGWKPTCRCGTGKISSNPLADGGMPSALGGDSGVTREPGQTESSDSPLSPIPCIVLDPFAGSGTTLLVARHHGRHAIGIELNADYCRIAADRLAQLSLLA